MSMSGKHLPNDFDDEASKLLSRDTFELQNKDDSHQPLGKRLPGTANVHGDGSWTSRRALQDRWQLSPTWQKCSVLGVTVLACLGMAAGLSAATGQSFSMFSTASAAMGSCKTSPELDEGPFYRHEELVRTDLVEDEPGVPMTLIVTVHDPDCNPLHGVFVDVWSCNSTGIYSGWAGEDMAMPAGLNHTFNGSEGPGTFNGTQGPGPGGPGGPGGHGKRPGEPGSHTEGSNATDAGIFLRGTLPTDRHGMVEFATIVPGWYPGRTEHEHVKIHVPDPDSDGVTSGLWGDAHLSHTGQMFFPTAFSDEVAATLPYSTNPVKRTPHSHDRDFNTDPTAVVTITRNGDHLSDGITAEITVIVDPAAHPLDKRR